MAPIDYNQNAASNGAASCSMTAPSDGAYRVKFVRFHLDNAPIESEEAVLTIRHAINAKFDVVIWHEDLSLRDGLDANNINPLPKEEVVLLPGETLEFTYPNTDANEWGIMIGIEKRD